MNAFVTNFYQAIILYLNPNILSHLIVLYGRQIFKMNFALSQLLNLNLLQ